jgi:hypothetical protein
VIDLEDLKKRPWLLNNYADAFNLHQLTVNTVLDAIDQSQRTWPELTEETSQAFRAAERRELLRFVSVDQIGPMLKRFEQVLRAGSAHEFGQLLARSPHRFNHRIVSILSERCRL